MKSMLKECGFKNIIRLNAERFPDRPLAGCSLSHYNALHEVDAPFIIFEDDCRVKNFNECKYQMIVMQYILVYHLGVRMNSHFWAHVFNMKN